MHTLVVAAVVVDADSRVLAARRRDRGAEVGGWEFPGGKVLIDEEPTAALRRELLEELSLPVRLSGELVHPAGVWPIDQRFEMRVWWCLPLGEPRVGDAHTEVCWVEATDLVALSWLPADAPVAEAVRRVLAD